MYSFLCTQLKVAYASRVYSFLCTHALTWKKEYARDAYATVRPLIIPIQRFLIFAALLSVSCTLHAQRAGADELSSETVVVYNTKFPDSRALAEYYVSRRRIPASQVIGLDCPVTEEISRDEYDRTIAMPLRAKFDHQHWWTISDSGLSRTVTSNKIRFIALIRGMPLKIRSQLFYPGDFPDLRSPVTRANDKAVDSELATLGFFRRQISGPLQNPYFRSFESIRKADPRLMLVARLDAPSADDVRRMINDSLATEQSGGLRGWTYLDARGTSDPAYKFGDDWLKNIDKNSLDLGRPAIIDLKEALFPRGYPMTHVMLYFGWYSDHPDGVFLDPQFRFLPGAIGVHIYSWSSSTIREPPGSWVTSIIDHGAAATLGNVYEPYLQLTPMLDLFHAHLILGMTFAESAYASLIGVSWMTTMIGDPLYRPFGNGQDPVAVSTAWDELRNLFDQDRSQPINLVPDLNKRGPTNPLFFEVAGLVLEDRDESNAAIAAFESAYRGYGENTPEGFRAVLDEAALLQKLNRKSELASLIHRAMGALTDPDQLLILSEYSEESTK